MLLPLIIIASWMLVLCVVVSLCLGARRVDLQQLAELERQRGGIARSGEPAMVAQAHGERGDHPLDSGVDGLLARAQHQVGFGGELVGRVDTGHAGQLARTGAGV